MNSLFLWATLGLLPCMAVVEGSRNAGCPKCECCGCCETGTCECPRCGCECCEDECPTGGRQAEPAGCSGPAGCCR